MPASVRSASTYASAATEASFSMPLPAGFAAGDVCYIFAEDRAAAGSLGAAPTGWTTVAASFSSGSSTSSEMAVYRRVMQAGDASPTVTGTSGRFSAVCVAIQGADNGTPEDVAAVTDGNGASASSTITSPGLTPAAANDLLLTGFGCGTPVAAQTIAFSTPSGMTLAASVSTTVAAVTESGMMVASLALASNAATGTEATTITGGTVNGQTVTIAVRSAAVAGGGYTQPGRTWLRQFRHRQWLRQLPVMPPPPVLPAPAVITAARRQPGRRPVSRFTAPPQVPPVAPPFTQAARRPAPRRARGGITAALPPVTVAAAPVPPAPALTQAARRPPQRRPRGTLAAALPPVTVAAAVPPAPAAVRATRRPPAPRPRSRVTAGTVLAAAVQALPAPRAVQATRRLPPARPRSIIRAAIVPVPPVLVWPQPVTVKRTLPLPRHRGRISGPLAIPASPGVTPPGAPPWTRAARRPPAGRSRPRRLSWPLQAPLAAAPFTVGTLTAATAPAATLGARDSAATLTAATAPQGTLTAATASAGTAAYGPAYGPGYGPQEGTLTATDTRTGGPA